MEKFAIDLDKVLDEFEDQEEKSERLAEHRGLSDGRPFTNYASSLERYSENASLLERGNLYQENVLHPRNELWGLGASGERQNEAKRRHSSPFSLAGRFPSDQQHDGLLSSEKVNLADADFAKSVSCGQPVLPAEPSPHMHISCLGSLPSQKDSKSLSEITKPLVSPVSLRNNSWPSVNNNDASLIKDRMTHTCLSQYKLSNKPSTTNSEMCVSNFQANQVSSSGNADILSCDDPTEAAKPSQDSETSSGLPFHANECTSLLMRGDPDGEQGSSDVVTQELPLNAKQNLESYASRDSSQHSVTLIDAPEPKNPVKVTKSSDKQSVELIQRFEDQPMISFDVEPEEQNNENTTSSTDTDQKKTVTQDLKVTEDATKPTVGFQAALEDTNDISDSEIETYLADVDAGMSHSEEQPTYKLDGTLNTVNDLAQEPFESEEAAADVDTTSSDQALKTMTGSIRSPDSSEDEGQAELDDVDYISPTTVEEEVKSAAPLSSSVDSGTSVDYIPDNHVEDYEELVDASQPRLLDLSEPPPPPSEVLQRSESPSNLDVVNSCDESLDPSCVAENDLVGENNMLGTSYDSNSKSQSSSRVPRPTSLNIPSQIIVAPSEMAQQPTPDSGVQPSGSGVSEAALGTVIHDGQQSTPDECSDRPAYPNTVSIFNNKELVGKVKPFWIPDDDAANCMHCDMKFTMMKRRHHCRACGKVVCSQCSNQKAKLLYMDNKEARVCQPCAAILNSMGENSGSTLPVGSVSGADPLLESPVQGPNAQLPSPGSGANLTVSSPRLPNPNNPNEYCSTISPLEQAQSYLNRPPPTVMVPVGVLKRGDKPRGEPKQVMFSDGIRPGSDLTELDEPTEVCLPYRRTGRIQKRVDKASPSSISPPQKSSGTSFLSRKNRWGNSETTSRKIVISDAEIPLPPIILPPSIAAGENPSMENLIQWLKNDQTGPVTFVLTKNLHIFCKIVKLDCCTGQECWNFASCGMATVGQDEIVFALEKKPEEDAFPHDGFRLFSSVYDNACKGNTVSCLGNNLYQGLFNSRENSGFLFVRSTFQCLNKLILPPAPYLIALLIQKWEVPWVKAFPLRLMLRLGAEHRCYPCPVVSIANRKAVYGEIGHTIMNVLADFRNFQYTLPVVQGVLVHVEDRKTTVHFPRNRYELIMKVLNNSNEHVLTFGANFSTEADSHLVCIQNESSSYTTQAINIQDTPRKITGASFIVFSGALKAASGLTAKSSIVEDGLLVQIPQDTMAALRIALRDMKDYIIGCGPLGAPEPEEVIALQWTRDDKNFNIGVKSPVDNRNMDGIPSIRIHSGTDYAGEHHLIRWTEVFFLQTEENSRMPDTLDPSRLAETVSQACCIALTPHLSYLVEAGFHKIGLRVTIGAEKVGYEVGSRGELLPDMYMNDLDSALIPVIMSAMTVNIEQCVVMELIFHILLK